MFRALMEASEFDEGGRAIPDYQATERQLLVEFGVVNPVDATWVNQCRDVLYNEPALLYNLQRFKPWDARVLYGLGVGYDATSDRFVLPIYDRNGQLINCKMYRPGGQPKQLWLVPHMTGGFLFPHTAWREQILILTEGEPDAISLRSYGFAAASGTLGSGSPVPEGFWWRNKDIYVWQDDDEAGREAAATAVGIMRADARSLRVVSIPDWPGKPNRADVSDYIQYLRSQEFDYEAVQRAIVARLNESHLVEHPHAVFDQTATHLSFGQALSAENVGRRIAFRARITARSERRYLLPVTYNIVCPAEGHQYCRRCPMRSEFHGNGRFQHDPRAEETLKMVRGSQKDQMDAYKRRHGIPLQCPDPMAMTQEAVNIEPVILNSSITEVESEDPSTIERQRREALIIVPPSRHIEENRDYDLEGFVYPEPKSQHGVLLVDRFTPSVMTHEEFRITPELRELLTVFQPSWQQGVVEKLVAIADDLSNSVTLIHARPDLHLAYRTVWHSALAFDFCGTRVDRGWIEALIVGDTRCGKSVAFRRLAEHYGIGLLVDCKNQTPAGILGSVVSSQSTGERYVVPGILPQQDGRVVCFDEFHVPRWAGKQGLIDVLSSTRSEGVARISKAASAQFKARVRAIWLANPGMGKLLSELGLSGVEVIGRLIAQPEDIARFDFALTLSQSDVSVDLINRVTSPDPPHFPRELARHLLAWIYSRRPEQIIFQGGAENAVMAVSKEMYERYDAAIPLVEPADQRTRVAKVAVSVAAQCFSTDPTGEYIIVQPEHVYAAKWLFNLWYDKPVMGYNRFSDRVREDRTIRDTTEVKRLFDEQFAPNGRRLAEELLRLDQFSERTFGTIVPGSGIFTRNAIQMLYNNRCIRLVEHGRREFYELTGAFVQWLRVYINE